MVVTNIEVAAVMNLSPLVWNLNVHVFKCPHCVLICFLSAQILLIRGIFSLIKVDHY